MSDTKRYIAEHHRTATLHLNGSWSALLKEVETSKKCESAEDRRRAAESIKKLAETVIKHVDREQAWDHALAIVEERER